MACAESARSPATAVATAAPPGSSSPAPFARPATKRPGASNRPAALTPACAAHPLLQIKDEGACALAQVGGGRRPAVPGRCQAALQALRAGAHQPGVPPPWSATSTCHRPIESLVPCPAAPLRCPAPAGAEGQPRGCPQGVQDQLQLPHQVWPGESREPRPAVRSVWLVIAGRLPGRSAADGCVQRPHRAAPAPRFPLLRWR